MIIGTLKDMYRSLFPDSRHVWCMRCKQKQDVSVKEYVLIETPTGNCTRLMGKCRVCKSSTSTFLSSRA